MVHFFLDLNLRLGEFIDDLLVRDFHVQGHLIHYVVLQMLDIAILHPLRYLLIRLPINVYPGILQIHCLDTE